MHGIGDLGMSCLNRINPDLAVALVIGCVGAVNRSVSQATAISVSIRGMIEIPMRTIAARQHQLHTSRRVCIKVP